MTATRPTIEPAILAAVIEAAPTRVRSRFDKQPATAEAWTWIATASGFEVQAGEELVRIEAADGVIRSVDQLKCSCLLSPKCFHILACVNVLQTAESAIEPTSQKAGPDPENTASRSEPTSTEPGIDGDAHRAAKRVRDALTGILRVGARAAGALLQSAFLRAGHDCRAVGLPMLGNTVLRIVEGVRRLRAQSDTADSAALREDLIIALHATELLTTASSPPAWTIGTNRREFLPVSITRLEGWFAEPILTRSGYCGVCIHLLSPDGRVHQVSELRPGDSQLVQQAYSGGIDLGTIVLNGSDLCRKSLMVQNLTASVDGHLGKGKSTRWAVQGDSNPMDGVIERRFAEPLQSQIETILKTAAGPPETQRGGWDIVAAEAEFLGAHGSSLVVRMAGCELPCFLRIPIDDPALPFRDNLQLLARCRQLRCRIIARMHIESAGEFDLLAIGPPHEDNAVEGSTEPPPRLQLPPEWRQLCNVGIDRLQRHHIDRTTRWGEEFTLAGQTSMSPSDDALSELDRRLTAVVLGGHRALPNIDSTAHSRDVAALRRRNQSTAASLIEALAASSHRISAAGAAAGAERKVAGNEFDTALLACSIYLQAARSAFHAERWKPLMGAE